MPIKNRSLEDGGKRERANSAKAANARERNIAWQYLNAGPNISNLARAAYHWWNGVPMLGGQDESGLILNTGDAPSASIATPLQVIRGAKAVKTFKNTISGIKNSIKNVGYKLSDLIERNKEIKELQKIGELPRQTKRFIPERNLDNDEFINNTMRAIADGNFYPEGTDDFVRLSTLERNAQYKLAIEKAKSAIAEQRSRSRLNNRNTRKILEDNDFTVIKNGNLVTGTIDNNGRRIIEDASFFNPSGNPNELMQDIDNLGKTGDIIKLADKPGALSTNSYPLLAAHLARVIGNPMHKGYKITNTGNVILNNYGGLKYKDVVIPYIDTPSVQSQKLKRLKQSYKLLVDRNNVRFPNNKLDFSDDMVYFDNGKYYVPSYVATKYRNGGSINIAPSKRGTFTAVATKHGMGVQEFASRVLRNKDNYSPAMVKKANFARNASKWNH